MSEQLAVYGTLRAFFGNRSVITASGGQALGVFRIHGWHMYTNGAFPFIIAPEFEDDDTAWITVEVYKVDTLRLTDQLEGYPHHYSRNQTPTPVGHSWIYHYPLSDYYEHNAKRIPSGDWLTHTLQLQLKEG